MKNIEEHILVLTTHNEDGECGCVTQDGCFANDRYAICSASISKQEAINKMSFALMEEGIDETDCVCLAEAALNALLKRS